MMERISLTLKYGNKFADLAAAVEGAKVRRVLRKNRPFFG